ncbi:hypothetical protein EN868_11205 [Mesorhizobium sp. M2D.F.Ca.ET.225.01.1.1]|uniref:hypothetical protein n=1 Tax=unclassified Mesorhizobium TaxID=325217 RepID=UPI000FD3FD7C|nr:MULTISPECIES: hypothetical protein [unclassified Mesorhizobium]TGP59552.1 hypothetical protein EN869_014875 [Mesorhizobium sp. M2D.F.Ca.ET.226.01.1.1]TGP69187.1 hypothetical protein EN868_11205 [Mesorhizobium sp. M2D.F.Ca.ET.225.01.1.1]
MSPAPDITAAEVAAAELWLVGYLVDNAKPMSLPSILRSAIQSGHKWRHVLRARFKPINGIIAARNSDGEWTWTLASTERNAA